MEIIYSSETSVQIQIIRRYISEYGNTRNFRCENSNPLQLQVVHNVSERHSASVFRISEYFSLYTGSRHFKRQSMHLLSQLCFSRFSSFLSHMSEKQFGMSLYWYLSAVLQRTILLFPEQIMQHNLSLSKFQSYIRFVMMI
jgi:hypothetical protein